MEVRDLENRFTYHPPVNDQADKYNTIRNIALQFALVINQIAPKSREKSLAITHLQETVMWANAAIACNEKGKEEQPNA